jgi:hypothetical protein
MDDPVKIKWVASVILLVYEHFRLLLTAVLMTVLMVAVAFTLAEGLVVFSTELGLMKPLSANTMLLSLRELCDGVLLVLFGTWTYGIRKGLFDRTIYTCRGSATRGPHFGLSQFSAAGHPNGRSTLADRA